MNFRITTIAFGMLILIFQGCASLELTQSRYGNGIGISFGNADQDEKAEQFRERKRQEIQDRKFAVQSSPRKIEPIETNSEMLFEAPEPITFTAPEGILIEKEALREIPFLGQNNEVANLPKPILEIETIPHNQSTTAQPEMANETQGNLSNLGYLGAVLVVAGLIFILLSIPSGYSILVLGVVLIILAYFLG